MCFTLEMLKTSIDKNILILSFVKLQTLMSIEDSTQDNKLYSSMGWTAFPNVEEQQPHKNTKTAILLLKLKN